MPSRVVSPQPPREADAASPPAAPRGRPRSPRADAAILGATMRLLVADGYESLSIERVAAEAGVAKTTIYRRYPAKRDLVIAALLAASDVLPPPGPVDDLRAALERLVEDVVEGLVRSGAIRVLASLMAADAREPGLMDAFRARVVEPRRQLIAEMLRAGVARGELRPDVDPLVVAEMLAGAVVAHHLILGATADAAWASALADTLWHAVAAPGPAGGVPDRTCQRRPRARREHRS